MLYNINRSKIQSWKKIFPWPFLALILILITRKGAIQFWLCKLNLIFFFFLQLEKAILLLVLSHGSKITTDLQIYIQLVNWLVPVQIPAVINLKSVRYLASHGKLKTASLI